MNIKNFTKFYKTILYKKNSIKRLVKGNLKKNSGRNFTGKKTVRFKQFSYTKKNYKVIDFKRVLWNSPGVIVRIEYDPYRTAFIALVSYNSIKQLSYILCPNGLNVGDFIISSRIIPIKVGNCTYLKNIPLDTKIHNIELHPFSGGKLARSAGMYGFIIEKNDSTCLVKLNNNTIFKLSYNCLAVIGIVSNITHKYNYYKNAGQKRRFGRKQHVRGVAMNAVDHPHGGGKGKKSPNKISYSPWRKLGKNIKTVKK